MEEKKKRPIWLKALIITGSVLVFLILCVFGIELWAKHKIRKTIEKEAVVLAGNPIDVGIGRISVSIPSRSVTVRNITLKSQNEDPSRLGFTVVSLDAGIDMVSLRGIGYKTQNGKPAVRANKIVVDSPHATLVTQGAAGEQDSVKNKPFQQAITEKLRSISLGNLDISDVRVDYTAWHGDDNTRLQLREADITIKNFYLDSMSSAADRIFFSEDIKLSAGRISYEYGAGSFVLEADTLSVDGSGKTFSLRRASLIPQYPKNEFAQKSKDHSDWTEFTIEDMKGVGVDYAGFFADSVLTVDSISLAKAHLASYKNRQVYQEPRVKPMLYQTIQDLPLKLDVRKMSFENADLEYDELALDGDAPGVVTITGWSGTAHNLTNVAEGHDRFMTINTVGTFMGGCRLHAVFYFPVSPYDNYWEVTGKAGETQLEIFNPAIEPLANFRIKSGDMHSMDFHITGTLEQSHIVMTMLYNDLSVALMKKHEHGKERGFLTFIADGIIIKNDNPKGNNDARVGENDFERDPNRSMYNYLWKTLLAGVKKTVI